MSSHNPSSSHKRQHAVSHSASTGGSHSAQRAARKSFPASDADATVRKPPRDEATRDKAREQGSAVTPTKITAAQSVRRDAPSGNASGHGKAASSSTRETSSASPRHHTSSSRNATHGPSRDGLPEEQEPSSSAWPTDAYGSTIVPPHLQPGATAALKGKGKAEEPVTPVRAMDAKAPPRLESTEVKPHPAYLATTEVTPTPAQSSAATRSVLPAIRTSVKDSEEANHARAGQLASGDSSWVSLSASTTNDVFAMSEPLQRIDRVRAYLAKVQDDRKNQLGPYAMAKMIIDPAELEQTYPQRFQGFMEGKGLAQSRAYRFDLAYVDVLLIAVEYVSQTVNALLEAAGDPRHFNFDSVQRFGGVTLAQLVSKKWGSKWNLAAIEARVIQRMKFALDMVDEFARRVTEFDPSRNATPRLYEPSFSSATAFFESLAKQISGSTTTRGTTDEEAELKEELLGRLSERATALMPPPSQSKQIENWRANTEQASQAEEVLELDRESVSAHTEEAAIAIRTGEMAVELQRAPALAPGAPIVLYNEGEALINAIRGIRRGARGQRGTAGPAGPQGVPGPPGRDAPLQEPAAPVVSSPRRGGKAATPPRGSGRKPSRSDRAPSASGGRGPSTQGDRATDTRRPPHRGGGSPHGSGGSGDPHGGGGGGGPPHRGGGPPHRGSGSPSGGSGHPHHGGSGGYPDGSGGDPPDGSGGGPPDGEDPYGTASGGYVPRTPYTGYPSGPYWKEDFKSSSFPALDGSEEQFDVWLDEGDSKYMLGAAPNSRIREQLGRVATYNFTGMAATWWSGLTEDERITRASSWPILREAVTSQLMSLQWEEKKWMDLQDVRYQEAGHEREKPAQFIARKLRMRRRIVPSHMLSSNEQHRAELLDLWKHVPIPWKLHVDITRISTPAQLLKEVTDRVDTLTASDKPHEQKQRQPWKKPYQYDGNRHRAEAMIAEADEEEEVYETYAAEVNTKAIPVGGANGRYKYPMAMNESRKVPPRPCRHCGNPKHYDPDCAAWKKDGSPGKNSKQSQTRPAIAYRNAYQAMVHGRDELYDTFIAEYEQCEIPADEPVFETYVASKDPRRAVVDEYVHIDLFFPTLEGAVQLKGVEAYVVDNMKANLLIGEDTQQKWQISTIREGTHTFWQLGSQGRRIESRPGPALREAFSVEYVDQLPNAAEVLLALAAQKSGQTLMDAKPDQAKAAVSNPSKLKGTRRTSWKAVAQDKFIIHPQCIAQVVAISKGLPKNSPMFLEGVALNRGSDSFVAPASGIVQPDGAGRFIVKVSNTTNRPIMVRSGELLGTLQEAAVELRSRADLTEVQQQEFDVMATKLAVMVQEQEVKVDNEALATRAEGAEPSLGSRREYTKVSPDEQGGETMWGPKTTDPGPDEIFPSEKLREVIDVDPSLPPEQRDALYKIVEKNAAAFGFDGRLGHLDTQVHIQVAEGTRPWSQPPYHASPEKRDIIDKQLDAWLQQGVIEASTSPWGAPIIIVHRNGKPRVCVDYRKLNLSTVADQYPIPKQTDILHALSGSQYLSVFDALSGFTQMEFDKESRPITAFRTHRGLHQFVRMPFGWRNGPPQFQRAMQEILSPYLWLFTIVYIDDIVVYSRTFEEHLTHVDKVLGAIAKAGLTLSPPKCHLGYRSITVLGNKVSRLGLSTHHEKLKAMWDIKAPTDQKQLESFVGLAVYFAAYIPYFSWMAAPLFKLMHRKEGTFEWGEEHQRAFDLIKFSLMSAPVRGHPEPGQTYRLYTDASGYAIAGALQQIQYIAIKDLRGTRVWNRYKEAYDQKQSVPEVVTRLSKDHDDRRPLPEWSEEWEDTHVPVERVIAYWSRTLIPAETRYSATEREALAAKESLVKFQPFVEGERILLITDHAALTWAKTYENLNNRLAAWGMVFSCFPKMRIIHRPGRVHSNVDPLSRLPVVPEYVSPARDDLPAAHLCTEHDRMQKAWSGFMIERQQAEKAAFVVTTRGAARKHDAAGVSPASELQTAPATPPEFIEGVTERQPHRVTLNVHMEPEQVARFVEGYQVDKDFKLVLQRTRNEVNLEGKFRAYRLGENGLLFWTDADKAVRLCVPKSERNRILKDVHELPSEAAHAGRDRTLAAVRERFYWPTLRNDVMEFVKTCDPCQKIKHDRGAPAGFLQPLEIPSAPFEVISLDFITGLPDSGGKTAILVVVDKLTKFAHFIPTTETVTAVQSAQLLFSRVFKTFGLPLTIVGDRDPRWTSSVWKEVAKLMKVRLALSTAKHPQTDGQTEVMNQYLETVLRAYVSQDQSDWANWLDVLQFAYNNLEHSSHKESPAKLLMGYRPRSPLDFLVADSSEIVKDHPELGRRPQELAARRESARDALQRNADKQAYQFDQGRREVLFEPGDEVLLNPHSLELVETKGRSRKLVQRKVGPFEVTEAISPKAYRIRLPDSYPMHNVVNLEHLTRYSRAKTRDRTILPNPRDVLRSSEEYEVERIVGQRKRKGKLEYRVKWKGYDAEHDSWQTARDLRNAPEMLKEWRTRAFLAGRSDETVNGVARDSYRSPRTIVPTDTCTVEIMPGQLPPSHNTPAEGPRGPSHTICFVLSDRNPVDENAYSVQHGYHQPGYELALLGLTSDDPLLLDGTYGDRDVGQRPISFRHVMSGPADVRFLPFVDSGPFISRGLRFDNPAFQYHLSGSEQTTIITGVNGMVQTVLPLSVEISLPLPAYVIHTIANAFGSFGGTRLDLEFAEWFTVVAIRQRVVRLYRVLAVALGFQRFALRLLGRPDPQGSSPMVGIQWDGEGEPTEDEWRMIRAYQRLGIEVRDLPVNHNASSPSLQEARDIIFGPPSAEPVLSVWPADLSSVPPLVDPPEFSTVFPEYDHVQYTSYGRRKTRKDRQEGSDDEDEPDNNDDYPGIVLQEEDELADADEMTAVENGLTQADTLVAGRTTAPAPPNVPSVVPPIVTQQEDSSIRQPLAHPSSAPAPTIAVSPSQDVASEPERLAPVAPLAPSSAAGSLEASPASSGLSLESDPSSGPERRSTRTGRNTSTQEGRRGRSRGPTARSQKFAREQSNSGPPSRSTERAPSRSSSFSSLHTRSGQPSALPMATTSRSGSHGTMSQAWSRGEAPNESFFPSIDTALGDLTEWTTDHVERRTAAMERWLAQNRRAPAYQRDEVTRAIDRLRREVAQRHRAEELARVLSTGSVPFNPGHLVLQEEGIDELASIPVARLPPGGLARLFAGAVSLPPAPPARNPLLGLPPPTAPRRSQWSSPAGGFAPNLQGYGPSSGPSYQRPSSNFEPRGSGRGSRAYEGEGAAPSSSRLAAPRSRTRDGEDAGWRGGSGAETRASTSGSLGGSGWGTTSPTQSPTDLPASSWAEYAGGASPQWAGAGSSGAQPGASIEEVGMEVDTDEEEPSARK